VKEQVRRWVKLQVSDQGVGIDEEKLQKIFDPFFTTKDVGEGTGLGLSIAYGIVEEHGGWIDVKSTPGEGSCFSVYLPETTDGHVV
jgi:signal transduction histidine kinase